MKKSIILLLITCLAFTSCQKDVLNKVPLDIISDNVVWTDATLVDAYLTECYAETYIFTNETPSGGLGWNDYTNGDAYLAPLWVNEVSDECMSGWFTWLAYQKKFGQLNINGGLLEWWENSYLVIRKLNEFIQRVPLSPLSEDVKKEKSAEARFLRAFNYFAMVKRYGGVPLITVPQEINAPEESLYPKRAKEMEVYDFVLSEMDAIANDLPEKNTPDIYGRPTKFAAFALKCRAALYAGSIAQFGTVQLNGVVGIDASKTTAYYQQAYDAAKLIMNSGNYSLYNKYPDKVKNFRQLFLDKDNQEVIFVRRHDNNNYYSGGNGWGYDFLQGPIPNGWGAGIENSPYLEMAEEFEHIDGSSGKLDRNSIQQGLWTMDQLWANKDPRFFATLFTNQTPWKGTLLDFHKGILKPDGTIQNDGSYNGILAKGNQVTGAQNMINTSFGVLKYLDESHDNQQGNWATSSQDWIVFRYGEVLLNYAEAAFNLGKPGDAIDAVNQIRTRAGIAPLSSIDVDKIRHERKVELAFEGQRYWDVRRWRIAETVLSKSNSGLTYVLDYSTGKYKLKVVDNIDGIVAQPKFYPQNYYLPITIARTGSNPNLVENPGY